MTSFDVQRYVRILIYCAATALTTYGIMTVSPAQLEIALGLGAFVANLVWSVFGMRITAKLKELSELAENPHTPVKGAILLDTPEGRELAAAIPGPVVTANSPEALRLAKQH